MSEDKRQILQRVASGEISPEEAAQLLETLPGSGPPPASKTSTIETELENVTGVRVVGTFRTVRIEGDPHVKTAVADGAHRVRTQDGTLVFEETEDDDSDYMLFGPMRGGRRGIYINAEVSGKKFRWENKPPILRIRMNPDLPLEVELTAGSAKVRGISGPITANLSAGAARFEEVRSPFRAYVDAGSINVSGIFDRGSSEIRCTAGKVVLFLEKGSSVRIKARSNLGKIALPGGQRWSGIGGGEKKVQVGEGNGTLDLEATTGAIVVEERR